VSKPEGFSAEGGKIFFESADKMIFIEVISEVYG